MTTEDPRERFDTQTTPPAPVPIHVHYHQQEKEVELVYARTDIPAPDSTIDKEAPSAEAPSAITSLPPDAAKVDKVPYRISVELLRVFSPSAEVRGHSPDQAVLQTGKREVGLLDIQAVGNYALKFVFDDGHDSGLYSWAYLYELARHRATWWRHYLKELEKAGASREGASILIKQL